jgi:fluoride exporter
VTALLVLLGAAIGAPARWTLDRFVQSRHDSVFPWGTLVINVSGSFVLGLVLAVNDAGRGGAALVALAGTGFCGGFTTFSSFGFETVRLAEDGSFLEASLNIAASVAAGLVAALVGWYAGRALAG